MPIDWVATGRRVAQIRITKRLTQQELAMQLGLSTRAMSELERGRVLRPSDALMDAIRQVLGGDPPQVDAPPPPLTIIPGTRPTRAEIQAAHQQVTIIALGGNPELWTSLVTVMTTMIRTLTLPPEEGERRGQAHSQRNQHLEEPQQARRR